MQSFDRETTLLGEDRVLGRSTPREQAIHSHATREKVFQISRSQSETASKRNPPETAFSNVTTNAQLSTMLDKLLSDPSLDHVVRFGTIAALMRRAVFYHESFEELSGTQDRLLSFTDLLQKSLKTYTDLFSSEESAKSAAKFRTALLLAAQDEEGSFTSAAAEYVELLEPRIPITALLERATEELSLAPVTSIRRSGDKLMLWSARKSSEQIKNVAAVRKDELGVKRWIAERVNRWSLSEEVAVKTTRHQQTAAGATWADYISYAGETLAAARGYDRSVVKELQDLVSDRVREAVKLKKTDPAAGAAYLAAIFTEVEDRFDKFANAFGQGFRMALQSDIEEMRRQLYFYQGLLYGLYEGLADSTDLLIKTCELVVIGAIFTPLTAVDFIAGTIYQLLKDIWDLCYGIYWIFTHLGEIAESIQKGINGLSSALSFVASLPIKQLLPLIRGAGKSVGPIDFAPYYKEFGHFIGKMITGGTLDFLLRDAKKFDLMKNSAWDNLVAAATYFFNWGAFLGPLVVEIIIAIYTGGAGLLAAVEKGGSELFIRISGKLYQLIQKMLKAFEKSMTKILGSFSELPGLTEKINDFVVKNINDILPMIRKGLKVDPEELTDTFKWLKEICEPAELVEFICNLLVAAFGPPPAEAPPSNE